MNKVYPLAQAGKILIHIVETFRAVESLYFA
jgi:hypothetical protein